MANTATAGKNNAQCHSSLITDQTTDEESPVCCGIRASPSPQGDSNDMIEPWYALLIAA